MARVRVGRNSTPCSPSFQGMHTLCLPRVFLWSYNHTGAGNNADPVSRAVQTVQICHPGGRRLPGAWGKQQQHVFPKPREVVFCRALKLAGWSPLETNANMLRVSQGTQQDRELKAAYSFFKRSLPAPNTHPETNHISLLCGE